MKKGKKSKVWSFRGFEVAVTCSIAVTLEGTIIHKSGLITGGKSTHNSNKKWDEKDLQGALSLILQPFI